MIKTLRLGSSRTKVIKTTKETVPLAAAPQAPIPTPRKFSMPSTPNYCDTSQQSDVVKAAMSGKPFSSAQKDNGLAGSLRTYMKAHSQDPALIDALFTATQETGVSFELMAIKAMIESNLGANTIAAKSTARGVFQYIDSTWLSLIKRHGKHIGYASYADALEYDPKTKRYNTYKNASISHEDILNLRDDAKASALIKAYQIIDEQAVLKEYKEGNAPTITDHYIMHMLGLPLSRTFYRLKNSNSPILPANLKNGMFSQAIALNPYFFYDKNKNALSAPQIYERFANTTGAKIDALRAIDKRYGNGQNVTAHKCTPTPIKPRIHTPSAQSFQNAKLERTLNKIKTSAGIERTRNKPRTQRISSAALLKFEPSPINVQ